MSHKVYWQSVSFASMQIEEWHEEFTLFQPSSGKTHFLNQMGMHVILMLSQSPATIDVVCSTLAKQFQLSTKQDFATSVSETLHRFEKLGLIEQVG